MPNDFLIYHNPRCSKSRQALELLRQNGIEPVVIQYLKAPLDVATLRSLGLPAREILRDNEDEFAALNLADPGKTEDELFAAIAQHPILLQRPIVVVGDRAVVARPPERVGELIESTKKA
jgi:arsenate reductase